MDKLERKWGRHAIPGLSMYFVFATLIGTFISMVAPGLLYYLSFSVPEILHGQVWRLVTWIFMPVESLDVFGIIFLLCVISWGRSLESLLGTFRLNLFLWMGVIISVIGSILVYIPGYLVLGSEVSRIVFTLYPLSTYNILMTLLLAIAICIPEGEVRIWFVLPVKMKWMLVFELAYMGYRAVRPFVNAFQQFGTFSVSMVIGLLYAAPVILAVLNMFLFFYFARIHITRKHKKRQKEFRAQFREPRPGSGIAKHKCAICGRTELTNPEMMFRYCSKCSGNKEYCEEHLYSHAHVR